MRYLAGLIIGVLLAVLFEPPERQSARELAAYARGQSDLCERLYQDRWGPA